MLVVTVTFFVVAVAFVVRASAFQQWPPSICVAQLTIYVDYYVWFVG